MTATISQIDRILQQNNASLAVGLLILYLAYIILRAKFFSATASIPGDFIDRISSIRLTLSGLQGQKVYFVNKQLKKHGPLVVIAPNSVATNDSEAIKLVYSSHKWLKSRFYSNFADFQSNPSLFSELRPKRAQILRKAFLPAFSRVNLTAMSGHVFDHLYKFLHILDAYEQKGKPLDVYRWFRYLTFEVIRFGGEYDMISSGDDDHPFVRDFDDSISWGILRGFIGPLLDRVPDFMWPTSVKHWSKAPDRTEAFAADGLNKWRDQKAAGQTSQRVDILQRLIDHGSRYPEEKLSEGELVTEMMEIMVAGGDTTAMTVIYGCYELARRPGVQQKLRDALKQSIPDPSSTVELENLESCKYLEWTIKEMLRLHHSLLSFLERVVPESGASISGYELAPGLVVSMSALVQHRIESIFPEPEEFIPESIFNRA
ncbi:hypothetical protein FANTH_8287 [Fusarium anthophilum]|uniref:Cytochrome P450 monooxygenase n=1 Tax=Fusarium anthophilum TaxID=48485 RepID=A0A8H4ZB31_9HYPO|nr:hypothetical protein FANTH_8287 [Fusarium anthophilum]